MHPHANPRVIVHPVRHPHSKGNEDNANYGIETPLTQKGFEQIAFITEKAKRLGIDHIACSSAQRTFEPVTQIAKELSVGVTSTSNLLEWRRPASTIGKKNDDPEVQKILKRRINEFGPGYVPCDGEETFEETVEIISHLLFSFLSLKARNVLAIVHCLRYMQVKSYIDAQGNLELFAFLFKNKFRIAGFNNASFAPPIWYGHPYGEPDEMCWNYEEGDSSHLAE